MSEAAVSPGPDIIKSFVKTLPNGPGVYRMFDEQGNVIYVGKARNLKARVTNYTRYEGNSVRIGRMISATRSMEFVTTNTESEALLLEANMIKRLRPRYNVLLRDDKSFPYILLATEHEAAELTKHRGVRRKKGHYFGPFASATAVNRTITALQKAFLLRNCSDSYYEGRTRPCLQHQIKRCAAPCTGVVSIKEYNGLVDDAVKFLSGKSKSVQAELSDEMQKASEDLDFERAALLRDRIAALSLIQSQGDMSAQTVSDADIFAIHLRKRGLDPQQFDVPQLVAATEGFSGAEIEQAVVAALYAAHAVRRPPAPEQVLAEIRRTRPLSVVMRERVASLRQWAKDRTVPAD